MVWTGPVGQHLNPAGAAMIPPPLAVMPELAADDVAWLNEQMALTDQPPVRYARELPIPPPPSVSWSPRGGWPKGPAPGSRRASMDLGLPTERIR